MRLNGNKASSQFCVMNAPYQYWLQRFLLQDRSKGELPFQESREAPDCPQRDWGEETEDGSEYDDLLALGCAKENIVNVERLKKDAMQNLKEISPGLVSRNINLRR